MLFLAGSFNVFRGNHGYEFAVIAVRQTGTRCGIPEVQSFRLSEIGVALAIWKMFFQKIRQCGERVSVELAQFQISRRLVIGKTVVTFPIISTATVGILPSESFVHVVGEGGGGPVVPVGAGFRIHEETVEQTGMLR